MLKIKYLRKGSGKSFAFDILWNSMDYDCTTFNCPVIVFRSVCLLMQVAMPCVLFAASPSELHLKGGTNAEMAPQIDYTVMVGKSFFGLVHLSCIYINVATVFLFLLLQVYL